MITLHDFGVRRDFRDADEIVSYFELDVLPPSDLAGIKAASDAGFPLHAAIDPCTAEIRDMRVLLLEPTARELRSEIAIRQRDI
jgi:hypothetical protein